MSTSKWVLEFADGRPSFAVSVGELVVGRAAQCTVRLDGEGISDRHVRLVTDAAGRVTIQDLDSHSGTMRNGDFIYGVQELEEDDEIKLGGTVFHVRLAGAPPRVVAAPNARTQMATETPPEVKAALATTQALHTPAGGVIVGTPDPEPVDHRTVQMESGDIEKLLKMQPVTASAPASDGPAPLPPPPGQNRPLPGASPVGPAPVKAAAGGAPKRTMMGYAPSIPGGAATATPPAPAKPAVTPPATARPAPTPTASRPAVTPTASRPAVTPTASRPAATPTASRPAVTPTASRPAVTPPAAAPPVAAPVRAPVAAPRPVTAPRAAVPPPSSRPVTAPHAAVTPPTPGPLGSAATMQLEAPVLPVSPPPAQVSSAPTMMASAPVVPVVAAAPAPKPPAGPYVPPEKGPFGSFSRALAFMTQMFALGKQNPVIFKPVIYDLMITTPISIAISVGFMFVHSRGAFYALLGLGTAMLYFVDYACNSLTASLMYDQATTGEAKLENAMPRVKKALPGIMTFAAVSALLDVASTYARERNDVVSRIVLRILRAIWTTATYVIMPALVIEGVSFGDAFKRSKQLMDHDPTGVGAGVVAMSLTSYIAGAIIFPLAYFALRFGGALHPILGGVLFFTFVNLYWSVSGWLKIAYSTCFYLWARECERTGTVDHALAPLPLRTALDAA